MTNKELFPVNYEVYPQILSVEPQMGSVNGGTLLTIKVNSKHLCTNIALLLKIKALGGTKNSLI